MFADATRLKCGMSFLECVPQAHEEITRAVRVQFTFEAERLSGQRRILILVGRVVTLGSLAILPFAGAAALRMNLR